MLHVKGAVDVLEIHGCQKALAIIHPLPGFLAYIVNLVQVFIRGSSIDIWHGHAEAMPGTSGNLQDLSDLLADFHTGGSRNKHGTQNILDEGLREQV